MVVNERLADSKDELADACIGMRNPEIVTLEAGVAIFRFASTKHPITGERKSSSFWARSPWWLLEEGYRLILLRYQAKGLYLGTMGRFAAAVAPSWNLMDVSIKAYVTQDINVYVGQGRTMYRDLLPNGMFVMIKGWPDIDQVYIPGIRGPTFSALRIVRQKVIQSDSFGFA